MNLTVSEFAKKIGVERASVYTWGKRGKLCIVNGRIDTENVVNKFFLKGRKEVVSEDGIEKTISKNTTSQSNTSEAVVENSALNSVKVALHKEDLKFKKLRNEKIAGKLISTDLVGKATGEVIVRYKASFVQEMDQLLRDILNSVGAPNEVITGALARLANIANDVSQRANMEAKLAIENSLTDSLSLMK
jgi:hypothetical protein